MPDVEKCPRRTGSLPSVTMYLQSRQTGENMWPGEARGVKDGGKVVLGSEYSLCKDPKRKMSCYVCGTENYSV